eukprot:15071861-Heterocapsa_arctica.AAC.1
MTQHNQREGNKYIGRRGNNNKDTQTEEERIRQIIRNIGYIDNKEKKKEKESSIRRYDIEGHRACGRSSGTETLARCWGSEVLPLMSGFWTKQ